MGSPYFKFLPPEQQPQAQPPVGGGIVWDDEKPTQPGGGAGIVWDDDKPKEKERGLNLDLLSETLENAPGSLLKNVDETVEGVKKMVTDPLGTATSLGKLGLSVMGDLPLTKAPVQIMQALANQLPDGNPVKNYFATLDEGKKALVEDYVNTYGRGNFLKTVATDPFRILTDLATIASGGELAAATLPGKLGSVTTKIAKAAQLGDPLTLAGKATAVTGKGALRALDATTGAGQGVMQDALRFGFQGGEAGEMFRKGIREADPGEVAQIARDGLDTWKQRISADFQADKDVWDKSNARLNFTPMRRAQMQVEDSMYSRTGQDRKLIIKPEDKAKIEKAMAVIEQWRNDPTAHTVLGMDDLKKAIRNQIDWKSDSSVVTSALTKLSNEAKNIALNAADPKYRTSLKNYSDAMEQMEEVEKALGLGDKTALHTTLTKLQKTVRNNANTQYGLQKDLAKRLEEEGGKSFMPMLSGQALSSWVPRGIQRSVMSGSMPAGAVGAFFNPWAIPGALGTAALTSPRLMGSTVHNIGRLAGTSRYIPETVKGTFGKFMSQPMRNAYANYDRMANENPYGGFARGGRARLAEGGMPEQDGPITALKGPYSDIGLGSVAQAARRRMGAVAPPKPPPVTLPEAPKVQFAKAAPSELSELLKGVDQITRPQEAQGDGDLQARLAEALAAAQAKAPAATATPTLDKPSKQQIDGGGGGGGGGTDPLDVAEKTQGDFEAKTTAVESGGNWNAVGKLGTLGRYQFMPSTLQGIIARHPELGITMEGFLKSPDMQKAAMKALTDENAAAVRSKVGRAPTGGELYLAHFLGAGGASALLSNPDRPLVEIVGQKVIDANPWVGKYKTGRELLDRTNRSFA